MVKLELTSGSVVKNPPANAGDTRDLGLISESERPPGVGNGNPLQDSCLENSTDRGTLQASVQRVAERKEDRTTQQSTVRVCLQNFFFQVNLIIHLLLSHQQERSNIKQITEVI